MNNKRIATNRNGTVLVATLVCLGLIGVLMFTAVQTSLRQQRQLKRELQMEQTRWLADAGVSFALKIVESGDEFESPVVIRPKLDETHTAEVRIDLTKNDDSVEASVTAWIGLEDRPELQTRKQITRKIENVSGE